MKPRNAWERLVAKHAHGRKICNCGDAYETFCPGSNAPLAERNCGGCAGTPNGHHFCEYGCSANQIRAREAIALEIEAETIECGEVDTPMFRAMIATLAGRKP